MLAPDSQAAIAEIREAELKRSCKKQLVIGSGASLLLIAVVAAVIATVYNSSDDDGNVSSGPVRTSSKSIEMVCTSTDYKHTCESSLSKAGMSENPDSKDLVKAAISAVFDEIGDACNHTQIAFKHNRSRLF